MKVGIVAMMRNGSATILLTALVLQSIMGWPRFAGRESAFLKWILASVFDSVFVFFVVAVSPVKTVDNVENFL